MSKSSTKVKFGVLFDDQIIQVTAEREDLVARMFETLPKRNRPNRPKNVSTAQNVYEGCKFYVLKNPVEFVNDSDSTPDSVFSDEVRKSCYQGSMASINPMMRKVGSLKLTTERLEDKVLLIIVYYDSTQLSNLEIQVLRTKEKELVDCLTIKVALLHSWTVSDVRENTAGGNFIFNDNHPTFKDILDRLKKPRVYDGSTDWGRDLRYALDSYGEELKDVIKAADDSDPTSTVASGREFVAFYSILRSFNDDVERIRDNMSSALKASNFVVHFIQPPFFSKDMESRGFEYQQETSWAFPIFLHDRTNNVWRKFKPRSDWMVISRTPSNIPFIISEVISQVSQSDRNRMLVQAIALARTGQHFMNKKRFFVVAVYIDSNMRATRYIVKQVQNDRNRKVLIHQKDFDLSSTAEQINFLREMYNLIPLATELSRQLDSDKEKVLTRMLVSFNDVQSLHSQQKTTKPAGSRMASVEEEGRKGDKAQAGDDSIQCGEVMNTLLDRKYTVINTEHTRVAIVREPIEGTFAYIKFLKQEKEIEVLKYLTNLDSPLNHTISVTQFWPVEGGTIISMPVAGNHLTLLNDPDEHLWSVAQQLFEAVGFMHEHNVAHLDLKPQNIIIPLEGGRLSIIDFGASILLNKPDELHTGVVGTQGYIAPEVKEEYYKPMLADLWSCGKTLEKLCDICVGECTWLLEIANQLMDPNPEKRPQMSVVLERMSLKERVGEDVARTLQPHLVPTPQAVLQNA